MSEYSMKLISELQYKSDRLLRDNMDALDEIRGYEEDKAILLERIGEREVEIKEIERMVTYLLRMGSNG